jgi:hypothetical protein
MARAGLRQQTLKEFVEARYVAAGKRCAGSTATRRRAAQQGEGAVNGLRRGVPRRRVTNAQHRHQPFDPVFAVIANLAPLEQLDVAAGAAGHSRQQPTVHETHVLETQPGGGKRHVHVGEESFHFAALHGEFVGVLVEHVVTGSDDGKLPPWCDEEEARSCQAADCVAKRQRSRDKVHSLRETWRDRRVPRSCEPKQPLRPRTGGVDDEARSNLDVTGADRVAREDSLPFGART